jgi:hypothetical protein
MMSTSTERNHTMTSPNVIVATEHQADLRGAAAGWRRASANQPRRMGVARPATVILRLVRRGEDQVVRELAALDDAPTPQGQVLLALIDGEAVAALSLLDGRVVANPFVLTQDAVALLRLCAKHLSGGKPVRRWRAIRARVWPDRTISP